MKNAELEKYRRFVFGCARCGTCSSKYNWWSTRNVCPVAEHSAGLEPYYPRGKVGVARGILEGALNYTERLADVLTWCTTCMNCVVQCGAVDDATGDPRICTPEIVEAMRADLVDLGLCPAPYKTVGSRIEKDRNPYGEPKKNRVKWAEGLNVCFVGVKRK